MRETSWCIGIDEVGRGAMAGPVFAAAMAWPLADSNGCGGSDAPRESDLEGGRAGPREMDWGPSIFSDVLVADSKTLSPQQRTNTFLSLIDHQARLACDVRWGLGVASVDQIDAGNIRLASLSAMRRALRVVLARLPECCGQRWVLIDGQDAVTVADPHTGESLSAVPVVGGDRRFWAVAAASIIAKVHRDAWMRYLHRCDSRYGFDQHKGYGTKAHLQALETHGVSGVHRHRFVRRFSQRSTAGMKSPELG